MIDARFLNNNSVTCEANHVKFKTLVQARWAHKSLLFIEIITKLYQKVEIGACTHSHAPIEVKFCSGKRTHVPLCYAKFHVNRCNELSLWGKNADFRRLE